MNPLDEPFVHQSSEFRGNAVAVNSTSAHYDEVQSHQPPPKTTSRYSSLLDGGGDPIELQIETLSPASGRVMFYSWYGLLALAIVIQSIVSLQWEASNMCDGDTVSLTKLDQWSSNCATVFTSTANVSNSSGSINESVADVMWTGVVYSDSLTRFLHIILSMRNPNTSITKNYEIPIGYSITNTSATKGSYVIPVGSTYGTYVVECLKDHERCSTLVLATQATGKVNSSRVTLILQRLDPQVALAIHDGSSVGAVYQKRSYTIASIVVRYTLMFFSLLHLARFLYHKKFTNTLYEQTWIAFLHGGLFLYLDPLFAAGVYIVPQPNVLSFLEFRIPTYFMALLVAFMFSLISSSMYWKQTTGKTNIYDPPWWTKLVSLMFLMLIFTIDIIDASKNQWDWNLEHCPNFSCNTLGYVLYGILILGVFLCTIWLYWLRGNLGRKPYLESRPQQLAVRVFIFVFTTTVLYFVIQSLTIYLLLRDISGIVTFQALIQIPPILVSVFFVNIMTLVYTTTIRDAESGKRVPIRPTDPRWKRSVWPETWYQWLSRHGGSMYIFFNEAEEMIFNEIQKQFQLRREMLAQQHQGGRLFQFDSTLSAESGASMSCLMSNTYQAPLDEVASDGFLASSQAPKSSNPSSPGRRPSGVTFEEPLDDDGHDANLSSTEEDDDDDDENDGGREENEPLAEGTTRPKRKQRSGGRLGTKKIFNAVSSVTKSVSRLVLRAEHELIDRTAHIINTVENRFFDVFQRHKLHKPFFNLETAIDCLNLSWEAYGVDQSKGDDIIDTGVEVRIPSVRPVARKISKAVHFFSCCHSSDSDDADDEHCKQQEGSMKPMRESTPVRASPSGGEYGATTLPPTADVPAVPTIDVEKYGYSRINVFEAQAVQVVISKMDPSCARHMGKQPRIVIAFRGTNNLDNAKQDLRIRRVAWHEVQHSTVWQSASRNRASVHEGFLGIWGALQEFVVQTVLETIAREPDIPYRVFVTGHSMGGAVSTLCAYVLKKRLQSVGHPFIDPYVYTYGQPRIGNKTFQTEFNKEIPNTFRIVNESDAVSFITMFGGCHVGMEVDIDRNGNYICEPMFMERTLRPTKGKGTSIAHHLLGSYAESLNAIAAKVACPSRCLDAYRTVAAKASAGVSPKASQGDAPS